MESMSSVTLKDVWKTYNLGEVKVEAARGISLTIKTGEFVAIMGPSGSGKSTVMHLIGCLDKPTKGHIYLGNEDVSKYDSNKLAKVRGKKIGFVFQAFNLISSLNAVENVTLPLMLQRVSKGIREEKAKKLLTMVGLSGRFNNRPSQLSGGERQRVAIARALINGPEIILADEPTGALDSKTGHEVMEIFSRLNKIEKRTIIIVTHEADIAAYAQRIIRFKDGRVVEK
ncbi:MAG: ABC transporter ATP-binding protein [Nanoarchaeota archaeon]